MARLTQIGRMVGAPRLLATKVSGRAAAPFPGGARTRLTKKLTFASAAGEGDSYSVLMYDYVPDILDKRGPFRAGHIGAAKKMAEEDKMVMAGAFADPVDGALFIFKNVPREEIDAYVQSDPYVVNGLVTGWKIKPWTVVVP